MAPVCLRCPSVPDRPAGIPDDDNDVVRILRRVQMPGKPASMDERIAKLAGRWRRAVLMCEELRAKRLGLLMFALSAYDKLREHGNGDEYEPQRAELVAFIESEYGDALTTIDPDSRRRVGSLIPYVQQLDVLSRGLRHNEYAATVAADAEAMDAIEYGNDEGSNT